MGLQKFCTVALLTLLIAVAGAQDFHIHYELFLNDTDYPFVVVQVINPPKHNLGFHFHTSGNALSAIGCINKIFEDIKVKDEVGHDINYVKLNCGQRLLLYNTLKNFTITYKINVSNLKLDNLRHIYFAYDRIFFTADMIFILPDLEPSGITVEVITPKDMTLFASLPKINGKFVAVRDLWGNLIYDFQKSYFTGGKVVYWTNYTTEWGDKYIYIIFNSDPLLLYTGFWKDEKEMASYAEYYLKTTERFAEYYRETIGPLPSHIVVFTDAIPGVKVHTDWFHFMQIWPKHSEPDMVHHLFHQYSFSPHESKLSFWGGGPIGEVLEEGLPTYFECVVTSKILREDRFRGKLFEYYVLNERGKKFGIGNNWYHTKYNVAAMRIYLLDKHIQKVTENYTLDDFVRKLWNTVKDRKKPDIIEDNIIIEVYSEMTGDEFIHEIPKIEKFKYQDFRELKPSFDEYTDWMADRYFYGNKLLFFVFLDFVAAKGGNWPHFATYPHNIERYRDEVMGPFLASLSAPTEDEIIRAMNKITGKNHSGFFEFWRGLGYDLDPKDLGGVLSTPINTTSPLKGTKSTTTINLTTQSVIDANREKEPGFDAVFSILGLLIALCLLRVLK